MTIPDLIRTNIREQLWAIADDLGWSSLPDAERARHYELWTRDPAIGGQLAHFMDPRKVRVYIKDSLIKPYERTRLSSSVGRIWQLLDLPAPHGISASFIKPHGRRLLDGKVVCWGRSRDWKLILMAAFERGRATEDYKPYGVVLLETGKTSNEHQRRLVREAASLLGIQKLVWED
jgi:hypothetical protein